ncbi:HypC/HybG/HupF family hydrogenase formation chaperone [Bacillus taeanensis]|uniref:HypC/HybG/HupF family hydrogenase formation chaperone n=1 Tax=Bacillus taeanensis TaxID=273032 RepID=A0A366Y0S5_9BACI|nr:HypC/HybG/HupF family hydrogenase formation chaperone [Bacillus taeanensis]RBW70965.1 HypC/HybG/HupF family hydrogenase formation chaperone [Bacillus taeanensis]
MCVGVPAKVIETEERKALVDVLGSKMNVGILFVPEVKVGDYVIIHAGQALTVVDEEFAKLSIEEWRKMIDAANS